MRSGYFYTVLGVGAIRGKGDGFRLNLSDVLGIEDRKSIPFIPNAIIE